MKILNYKNKIKTYLNSNSSLTDKDLENLLTIDSLYVEVPEDLEIFREIYAHLDPRIINETHEGINFLNIARSKKSKEELSKDLNDYINIKFNDIENLRSYEDNMVIFKKYSAFASEALEEILKTAMLPTEIITILKEKEEIKECRNIFQMLEIYKNTSSNRIKFEILRKLGLIVLIARINRSINVKYLDEEIKKVIRAFTKGLGFNNVRKGLCYLWLDYQDKVRYAKEKEKARYLYQIEIEKRRRLGLEVYPLQTLNYYSFKTNSGNKIINLECRNKFKKEGKASYASFIEKMVRKNLEFPNQIHDAIGLKIVIKSEKEIPNIIHDLEKFLGGSSTRKREKNTYHRFNKRFLNDYSSKDYYVWKAIYDITLMHPSIDKIRKIIETTDNKFIKNDLEKRLRCFLQSPQDFVIEVQLQDIKSYLLSITRGSPTDHSLLKMSQIRNNSFYKFFPQEIYEKELLNLKLNTLNKNK